MSKDVHVFFKHNETDALYETNTPYSFTIQLPEELNTKQYVWECCLKELCITRPANLSGVFAVYADLVRNSPVYGAQAPILRTFHLQDIPQKLAFPTIDYLEFHSSLFFPVHKNILKTIRFYIRPAPPSDKTLTAASYKTLISSSGVLTLRGRLKY